jgi:creatinine amidohydrolase/Fe(II)-dependent formamide hydrolase-like protein
VKDNPTDRDAFIEGHQRQQQKSHGPSEISAEHLQRIDWCAAMRRDVAIVSMGNSAEAHSSALAPDIDDRIGATVAIAVANRTGARYLGHCPYATDRLGGLATVWSPACVDLTTFVAKVREYLRFMLAATSAPKHVWLLSGHGGNGAIEPHLGELARDVGIVSLRYALALIAPCEQPRLTAQHASTMEHSVAKHLGPGCFDDRSLSLLNEDLTRDFESTIKQQPALGGMAGYYLYGDARFDAIRQRYPGVKSAIADLVRDRRVDVNDSDGKLAIEHTIDTLSRAIINQFDIVDSTQGC